MVRQHFDVCKLPKVEIFLYVSYFISVFGYGTYNLILESSGNRLHLGMFFFSKKNYFTQKSSKFICLAYKNQQTHSKHATSQELNFNRV